MGIARTLTRNETRVRAFAPREFGELIVPEIVTVLPEERVRFYRELANVSAQFAAMAKDSTHKQSFNQIAMQWMRLAEWTEAEAKDSTRLEV